MEVNAAHRQIPITDPSQPSAARYAAHEAAEGAGFGEEARYRAGLVATELGTNLVKHAKGGELLVRCSAIAPHGEIEIISIDRGPGIADLAGALSDGHSTAGTPGTGLGAVRRLSEEFDIHSQPGRGTVILARLRSTRAKRPLPRRLAFGVISVAKQGESVCGDAWQVHHHHDGAMITIVDGLGHGMLAADASAAAIRSIIMPDGLGLTAVLERMHDALRHTRGAAAAVADIRLHPQVLRFAGIGNVAASISGPTTVRHAVSLNGTLGQAARTFREFDYPWESEALFVMHSDGLGSRWTLDGYHGLRQREPAVVSAVLYRDFGRERDDVTVVVGREAA